MSRGFRWIREDVELDFELPDILKTTIEEAEELDLEGNIEYTCVAKAIDVLCKNFTASGRFTESQWMKVVYKYPEV